MEKRVLLHLCHMGGKELDFIKEAFDENWVVPLGPNVDGFEKDLDEFIIEGSECVLFQAQNLKVSQDKELFKEKQTIALSSGTAAIHMGLIGAGVSNDDEVMVQSFTFSASANPVVYQGATPVFIDSEEETWNMNPELLETAIKERTEKTGKKPKAIIPVSLYGMPPKMREIIEIANKWEIPIVEDAAEAFGSRYMGQMCGTFGLFGALSFNGNKMITTSGGGALICPNKEEKKKVLKYSTQSREPFPWYEHKQLGFNYRMSNICAGIGRGQMYVANDHIRHHKQLHAVYTELFEDCRGIKVHDNPGEEFDSNFWLTTITFEPKVRVKGDDGCGVPEAIRRRLEQENIESRHLWKPMHLQPFFKDCHFFGNGTSEDLFKRGLCLPSGPLVGEKEAVRIADIIKDSIL